MVWIRLTVIDAETGTFDLDLDRAEVIRLAAAILVKLDTEEPE